MAAANYSAYNRRAASVLKKKAPAPRLIKPKPATTTVFRPGAALKPGASLLKKTAPAGRVAPAASPLPIAPTLQAVPQVAAATGPPPQSLQTASDRGGIKDQYGRDLNGINRNIYDAALSYGGVNKTLAFGYDPTGGDKQSEIGVTTNPDDNSALSVIGRNTTAQNKNVDEVQGAQNTFFSSNRLNELQNVNSESDRQRAAAKKQYDDAMAGYVDNITNLRGVRDKGLRDLDIADINAAIANAPVAEAPVAPGAEAEAAGSPAPGISAAQGAVGNIGGPKSGYQFVMDHGPNAGLSYNLVPHNGQLWRKYEDGRLVPR